MSTPRLTDAELARLAEVIDSGTPPGLGRPAWFQTDAMEWLVRDLREARALLREAQDALIWCSGSADFNPGGIAREGWVKGPQVVLAKLDAVLGEGQDGV